MFGIDDLLIALAVAKGAVGVGKHAYNRQHDPDYARENSAFGAGLVNPVMGAVQGAVAPGSDLLTEALRKISGPLGGQTPGAQPAWGQQMMRNRESMLTPPGVRLPEPSGIRWPLLGGRRPYA